MFEAFIHEMRLRTIVVLEGRSLLDAVLGLPALSLLMALGFMTFNSRSFVAVEQPDALERSAQSQLQGGHYVEARIIAKRLAQGEMSDMRAAMIEAKALRGMGRDREATRILARVAPLDHAGYAPAHIVQATFSLAQQPPDLVVAERHIANALQVEPDNQDALELASRLAAGQKDWKLALTYLERLAMDERADLMLLKATALQLTGLKDESVKWAHLAEQGLRSMKDRVTVGADRIRYSIAASLSLQRHFEPAAQSILDATRGTLTQEDRQILGGIYFSWSMHLKETTPADKAKVLEILEKGIQMCPDSQDIIMAFLTECAELTTSATESQRYVQRVLGEGSIATSYLHYYLGVQDWKQGNHKTARTHFELSRSLNPDFKVVSNNLAMAIASTSTDHAELEKALFMMNELIRQEPNNSFFLYTRGHVHKKLERYKQAAVDLEMALPQALDQEAAHATLADIYQQLGMSELAVLHRASKLTRP